MLCSEQKGFPRQWSDMIAVQGSLGNLSPGRAASMRSRTSMQAPFASRLKTSPFPASLPALHLPCMACIPAEQPHPAVHPRLHFRGALNLPSTECMLACQPSLAVQDRQLQQRQQHSCLPDLPARSTSQKVLPSLDLCMFGRLRISPLLEQQQLLRFRSGQSAVERWRKVWSC